MVTEDQQTLFKGEMMEEALRAYFLNQGYYVAKGVKFKYQGADVTDIDLFLYGKHSSLTRERINVDIKNKKSPQAFERIVIANGLMKLLQFDSCLVATTDNKPQVEGFGKTYKTKVLNGVFLQKLKLAPDRFNEDSFLQELGKHKNLLQPEQKDWRTMYELSKSRLLTEMDYSGFNIGLQTLKYFLEMSYTDKQRRDVVVRMTYIILSHLLLTADFIVKEIVFLEPQDREKRLLEGLKFGNLGPSGVSQIVAIAGDLAGKSAAHIMDSLKISKVSILRDFLVKNENAGNLFAWAKEMEHLGFSQQLVLPNHLESPHKGLVGVMLDFFEIPRQAFFESFSS